MGNANYVKMCWILSVSHGSINSKLEHIHNRDSMEIYNDYPRRRCLDL